MFPVVHLAQRPCWVLFVSSLPPCPPDDQLPLMNAAPAHRLADVLGESAAVTEAYGDVHVDVPPTAWLIALEAAHAQGLRFFDWLSAYEDREGLAVVAHLAGAAPGDRLLLRTQLPLDGGSLPTATGLWAGAAWHERETWEMFGIDFAGHPRLEPLLLQPDFPGRPLRKDFVLASRVVKEWPGTKDPADRGGPADGRPVRRRTPRPPGVPEGWGTE